ncbi:hypothetical protein AB0C00_17590, partial [Micromonospora carbonacea]
MPPSAPHRPVSRAPGASGPSRAPGRSGPARLPGRSIRLPGRSARLPGAIGLVFFAAGLINSLIVSTVVTASVLFFCSL